MVAVVSSSDQTWVEEEDVRSFRQLIDVKAHNRLGEIEDLPVIIEVAERNIEGGLGSFRSSGIADVRWRDKLSIKPSYGVLDLYREARESVHGFVLRGRNLMRDMVNHNFDDVQRAFDGGKYEIVNMRLGDVKDHLKGVSNALETAKGKLNNAASTTADILKLISSKLAEKVASAEDTNQGWSAGYSTALHTFGITIVAAAAVLAPFAIPVAGLTGFYQFTDALDRYNLRTFVL